MFRVYNDNMSAQLTLQYGANGSQSGINMRGCLYKQGGVVVCSRKKAYAYSSAFFASLFLVSFIIAYLGPQNSCPCAGLKPLFVVEEDGVNASRSIIPMASNGEVFPWNNLRLPTFVRPERYHITIHPNLTTLEVKGQTSIDFKVDKKTDFIVFHSKDLTITERVLMNRESEEKVEIARLLEYSPGEQVFVEFEEELYPENNYTLLIKYKTRLSLDLEGFYLSSYVAKNGKKKYLATTTFEPTFARSAFPCFDEPQLKAKFKMSILRDRFHISLFNMPIVSTDDVGFYMGTGLVRDDFEESLEMSTYLVAFVVCDYENIHTKTANNVTVSVYAPADLLSQAKFALDTSTTIMQHYEEFFGVPYPLPKQDLIAIPDSASGAMENWGLITYRETSILYDTEETSASAHQWVAVVIAHELAHQWFGNLVTMRWWNDLWLNEGFASFLEYLGVNHIMPAWHMMDQFILEKTQEGLIFDSVTTSHPISVHVKDPVEIEALFDSISYSKGAALLYMLDKFLSRDIMRAGLNEYLNTHKYGNADTTDLWTVMSKHTNHSLRVKAIMDTWTRQMGFPLISIKRDNSTGLVEKTYRATQSRFVLTQEIMNVTDDTSPFKYKWYVPLSFYTNKGSYTKEKIVWMNMTDVTFESDENAKWIKANVNQSGFYRVNYTQDLWDGIIDQLASDHAVFSPADRASLLDDAFTLARAGVINVTVPLRMAMYLRGEKDYVPWATALNHLEDWRKCLVEASPYRMFQEFLKYLLEPASISVGWEDTGDHLTKLLRADILTYSVVYGIESVVTEAVDKFQNWMKKGEKIPPNLREVVYTAGIKYGGVKEWQYCLARYNTTRIPSERKLLLKVLGSASDPWILQRYLLSTLDRNTVKVQDVKTVLGVVASNPSGHLLVWRFTKAYWGELEDMFGFGSYAMAGIMTSITAYFTTEHDLLEVENFFRPLDAGSGMRAHKHSVEMIQLNIHFVKKNEGVIFQWLRSHKFI